MKKSLISIVVASVFLISSITIAGVDPEPFAPEIRRLGYIEQRLNSIDSRIRAVLSVPPDDQRPIHVVRIKFMSYRLGFLNWFMVSTMDSIIDAVLGTPPDDIMPVRDALESIGYVMSNDTPEGGITEIVGAYLNEYFPDGEPIQPGLRIFYNALIQFSGKSDMITENATDYIDQIDAVLTDCSRYDNEADCTAADGCTWDFDTATCTEQNNTCENLVQFGISPVDFCLDGCDPFEPGDPLFDACVNTVVDEGDPEDPDDDQYAVPQCGSDPSLPSGVGCYCFESLHEELNYCFVPVP